MARRLPSEQYWREAEVEEATLVGNDGGAVEAPYHGRPAAVHLAVLVDRGGRELPVQADYAAARLSLPATQSLRLTRDDHNQFAFSVEG